MRVLACAGAEGSDCELCGTVASGSSGAWLEVQCAAGVSGNNIRFEHDNYIQICEVNIQGTPVPELSNRLTPIGGAHKDLWTDGWGYDKLFDTTVSTNVWDNGCYHSLTATGSWVEVHLDGTYAISSVSILNRGDCCGRFLYKNLRYPEARISVLCIYLSKLFLRKTCPVSRTQANPRDPLFCICFGSLIFLISK